MKVYDNDWFLRFELDYDDAARLLADWGVTFILAQSRYLPMPDTAIKSEVPEHLKDRYAAYDDRLFREALRREGIQYVATCLVGLDPEAIAADPGLVPVDAEGRAEEKIDWYQGIPPDRTTHIDGKVALVERAAQELRPDGVHLGFMRWPGFWELWLPDVSRADFPDYDYSPGNPASLCRADGGGGTRSFAAGSRPMDRPQRPHRLDRLEVRHRRAGHRPVPRRRAGDRSGRGDRAQHPALPEERLRPGHGRGVRAAARGSRAGGRCLRAHVLPPDPAAPGVMDRRCRARSEGAGGGPHRGLHGPGGGPVPRRHARGTRPRHEHRSDRVPGGGDHRRAVAGRRHPLLHLHRLPGPGAGTRRPLPRRPHQDVPRHAGSVEHAGTPARWPGDTCAGVDARRRRLMCRNPVPVRSVRATDTAARHIETCSAIDTGVDSGERARCGDPPSTPRGVDMRTGEPSILRKVFQVRGPLVRIGHRGPAAGRSFTGLRPGRAGGPRTRSDDRATGRAPPASSVWRCLARSRTPWVAVNRNRPDGRG